MPLSTFLNGRDAITLRGLKFLALSDQGRPLSHGGSDDAGGGFTSGSWTAGSYVPCRVDPAGARGGEYADQIDERSTHVIVVPGGTDVTNVQRFEVQGRGTYEVTAVRTRTAEVTRELEAIEV